MKKNQKILLTQLFSCGRKLKCYCLKLGSDAHSLCFDITNPLTEFKIIALPICLGGKSRGSFHVWRDAHHGHHVGYCLFATKSVDTKIRMNAIVSDSTVLGSGCGTRRISSGQNLVCPIFLKDSGYGGNSITIGVVSESKDQRCTKLSFLVLITICSDLWLENAIKDWREDFHSSGTPAKVNGKPVLDLTPLVSSGSLRFQDLAKLASTCKSVARLS